MDWDSAYFLLFCTVAVLVGAAFDYRKKKLLYLERLAAIEKGISPESLNERPLQFYFRRGLLWLIPGLGLAELFNIRPWGFQFGLGRSGGVYDLPRCGIPSLLFPQDARFEIS